MPEPAPDTVARGLEAARGRTQHLTEFDDAELTTQHSPLMSPLVWDLAHIGQQEDLWLLRGGNAAARACCRAKVERLYDAFEHPRAHAGQPAAADAPRGPHLHRRRPRPGVRRARRAPTSGAACSPT